MISNVSAACPNEATEKIKLSVIVVAFEVDVYLQQCLESCAFLEKISAELVVVVNKSSDNTAEIASNFGVRNPAWVKLLLLDENVGLGAARNFGLECAGGEFVAFLDGDDWYAAAAGDGFKHMLKKADFDICIFNHAQVLLNGSLRSNRGLVPVQNELLSSASERKAVFRNLGTAWNKLCRRQFLIENRIAFDDGYYEDIFWNFMVLIKSRTIRVHKPVLLKYRQRQGSILNSTDERHFDLLVRYDELLQFMRSDVEAAGLYGREIYHYCSTNVSAALRKKRVPPEREREYMRAARGLMAKLRVGSLLHSTKPGIMGVSWRELLLWVDHPGVWRVLDTIRRKI